MKRILLLLLLSASLYAQTGIGTTTPNASAKLDVFSTNKGFLPPRVTLTSTSDASTIASPAEGLLVYNLGSVGLQAGYYYWNGANWATIATATSAGNGVTASDMVKLYGEAHSSGTGKISSSTGFVFTVPVSGRYLFDFTSSATTLGGGTNTLNFQVRQGATVLASDIQSSYNNNVHVEYNGKVEVNLQAGVSYNVYNYATSGSFEANDYDRVYYKMVAGNLPVTGQSVEYGLARYTGADGSALSTNAMVPFDANAQGNLAWSSVNNRFTLKANKTYELESYLAILLSGAGVAGIFQIYNYTNNAVLASGLYMSIDGSGGTYHPNANGPMRCVVTPTSDIEVGVRLSSSYGGSPSIIGNTSTIGVNGAANQSYFMVKQIGSSAFVNPWTLSGNDVYNTTGEVGIGNTSPNAKLDVRTSPTSTTDPGAGTIGLGTSAATAASSGSGALRYNSSTSKVEVSNGTVWQGASAPIFAQFQANAAQSSISTATKINFQSTFVNVGGISIASNNAITLPAGRIYRIDFNAGWVSMTGGWARFAIYNNGTIASIPAHLESVSGTTAINSSGATTTFINTSGGSTTIDVRYIAPSGSTVSLGDTGNGTSYPYIVIQAVD
jgi:hypothetical protein